MTNFSGFGLIYMKIKRDRWLYVTWPFGGFHPRPFPLVNDWFRVRGFPEMFLADWFVLVAEVVREFSQILGI